MYLNYLVLLLFEGLAVTVDFVVLSGEFGLCFFIGHAIIQMRRVDYCGE